MFGIGKKKDPYSTVTCRANKLEGGAVLALGVAELDLPGICKLADSSEVCSKISFGRIYQKPGSLLAEHKPDEQGYNARYDKITKSIAVNLRQGLMRQTLIFVTREPVQLAGELSLTLEQEAPPEPTVS
ncbi:hypothetical protein [Chitinimonas sp.]|uniref:hypothetical protein n=1 Tax=Chitinimonas sp. TaxID=1934313 RepID=UPI0035AEBE54